MTSAEEKSQGEDRDRYEFVILNSARENVSLEQRSERSEEANPTQIQGRNFPSTGSSKCKSPRQESAWQASMCGSSEQQEEMEPAK